MCRAALILVCAIALASARATAGEPATLTLTLVAESTSLLAGEPLRVRLQLHNTGPQAVTGDFYPTYHYDRVRVQIAPGGGEFTPYLSKAMEIAGAKKRGAPDVTIPAGGMVEGSEFVSFDLTRGDFALPIAGSYRVQALLYYDHYAEQLASNVVTIAVREPQGADAEALNFIRSNGIKHLLTPEAAVYPTDEVAIGKLREFLTAYPNGTYSAYAQAGLAAICATGLAPAQCSPVRCLGDCDGNDQVTVDELVRGVDVALGNQSVTTCPNFDLNNDSAVTVEELVGAVVFALNGCPD